VASVFHPPDHIKTNDWSSGMNEELLGHLEFWTQFRQYLDDHKMQVRLGCSAPGRTKATS